MRHRSCQTLGDMTCRACALVLFGLAACDGLDSPVQNSRYATLDALKRDGGDQKGWVPPWLPSTSTNILEAHRADAPVNSMRLSFSPHETWPLPATCEAAGPGPIPKPALTPSWWPRNVPSDSRDRTGYAYFNCTMDTGRAILAIDRNSGTLLFWRPWNG